MIDMTNLMMHRVDNLNIENERISHQMSTSRKLQHGSDDPVLYTKLLNIEENTRTYKGLQVQIQRTTAQNTISDKTMQESKKMLDLIKVDLIRARNAGLDDSSRAALATNLDGVRETLITLANTQIDGEYLFSGSASSTRTFNKSEDFKETGKVDFNGNGFLRSVAVEDSTYRPRGITALDAFMYPSDTAANNEQLKFTSNERIIDEEGYEWKVNDAQDAIQKFDKNNVLISPEIEISITGTPRVFNAAGAEIEPAKYTTDRVQETKTGEIDTTRILEAKHNFFDDINIMINALNGYSTNSDGSKADVLGEYTKADGTKAIDQADRTVAINEILGISLEQTSAQFNSMNTGHAELGGRNNVFNISLERIEAKQVHYNILMQELGGVDMAKLAMESKSLEMTYQAVYSTISKMHKLSLLNFLN